MANLADTFDSSMLTEEQLDQLRKMVGSGNADNVEVKIFAGRPAIFQKGGSGEPVQMITNANPHAVKWLLASWSTHFEDLARRGRSA